MQIQVQKPRVIFVLGGPGSGKGTQCHLFVEKYSYAKFIHLSMGQILRQASQDNKPATKQIRQLMKEGKMVPSKPLVELVKAHISKKGSNNIYVLDGFPRNKENITAWQQVIKKEFIVQFLLYFQCSEKELRNRLLNRAKTSNRSDDNPETIEKRLKTFTQDTKPMLSQYKKSGGEIVFVNGLQSIQKVQRDVTIQLKKHRMI